MIMLISHISSELWSFSDIEKLIHLINMYLCFSWGRFNMFRYSSTLAEILKAETKFSVSSFQLLLTVAVVNRTCKQSTLRLVNCGAMIVGNRSNDIRSRGNTSKSLFWSIALGLHRSCSKNGTQFTIDFKWGLWSYASLLVENQPQFQKPSTTFHQ